MSHNLYKVNDSEPNSLSELDMIEPETALSEAAPNSTPTGSTFNYAVSNNYRWDGTQASINTSYVTDHGDGSYTLVKGTYLIACCVSFQKSYSVNAKADWRWYNQTTSSEFGASTASTVNPYFVNDACPSSSAQIFTFTSSSRIALRCKTIITGTFQNSNQDLQSNANLVILRLS